MSPPTAGQTAPSPATPGPPAELPKQYRPSDHEGRIRQRWDHSGAFHADPARVPESAGRAYAIVIPPPNVTDRLHLGHALNNTLQDVLARAHRMMGYETLWMPGTDHAGIATQAVVERRLRNEGKLKGPLKQAMTREAFVAQVQAFKDEYEATITGQLKAMGCSCDWQRQRFTMDEQCTRAVYEAFFRLFKDGLIYRGKRLVNWDPVLQTAVADDETEDQEVQGFMYYLRYPLVHAKGAATTRELARGQSAPDDAVPVTWSELRARGWPAEMDAEHDDEKQAWVTVATTRPETYLGDTAVAVNPRDPRALALRGLSIELPLVGRVIPLIEDDYVVMPAALQADPDAAKADAKAAIATGFLKVTPAHDPNDYAIGERHKLPVINVMAPDGSISDKHGWTDVGGAHLFLGRPREEARKLVLREFQDRTVGGDPGAVKLFAKSVPYTHSVPHSDRSKAAIEPYLSDQWYVRVTDPRLRGAALAAMASEQRSSARQPDSQTGKANADGDGGLRFHPERYAKTFETWHENIRDWCISRQLWWGHRIPVWSGSLLTNLADRIDWKRVRLDQESLKLGEQPGLEAASDVLRVIRFCEERGWLVIRSQRGETLSLLSADLLDQTCRALAADHCHICINPASEEAANVGTLLEAVGFTRDPDVLDTWFSSALWPMSTMGWPDATPLLQTFNPTSVLCTAREIITLWVSRMVMFNRYFLPEGWPTPPAPAADPSPPHLLTSSPLQAIPSGHGRGPLPFRDVFIHAMIQDGEGRKMSKSLGNGVDPLDIIASHGTDAMRFVLCQMTTQTQDVRMPVEKDPATGRNTSPKFDLGRNFANKLWNAARFAIGILEAPIPTQDPGPRTQDSARPLPDRWMLSRLLAGAKAVNCAIESYEFSDYAGALYDLLWRDFCDWYLEAIKPTVGGNPAQRAALAHTLEAIVRMLHPIAPYITEVIWERLKNIETAPVPGITLGPSRIAGLLATAAWPVIDSSLADPAAEALFARIQALVTAVREVRAQHNVPPKRRITLHLPAALELELADGLELIRTLSGLEQITTAASQAASVAFRFEGLECRLSNLADAVDSGTERSRLEKLIADSDKDITTLEARLANPGYAQKAPPAMVQQTRDQLAKAIAERNAAAAALKGLA